MRRLLLLTALAVVLFTGSARAQEYRVFGPGTVSCGTWAVDRRTQSPGQIDLSWVLGFLSGVGYAGTQGENPLRGVDANAVAAWLDNYCQSHPLQNLLDAAKAFAEEHPH